MSDTGKQSYAESVEADRRAAEEGRRKAAMSDGRVEIPLRMLDGNLAALLANEIACNAIGLRIDPESDNGVILIVRMNEEQKKDARAKGFRTQKRKAD